jgi:hypothetical protein
MNIRYSLKRLFIFFYESFAEILVLTSRVLNLKSGEIIRDFGGKNHQDFRGNLGIILISGCLMAFILLDSCVVCCLPK